MFLPLMESTRVTRKKSHMLVQVLGSPGATSSLTRSRVASASHTVRRHNHWDIFAVTLTAMERVRVRSNIDLFCHTVKPHTQCQRI